MKPTDFANALTDFLGRYLTVECGLHQTYLVLALVETT